MTTEKYNSISSQNKELTLPFRWDKNPTTSHNSVSEPTDLQVPSTWRRIHNSKKTFGHLKMEKDELFFDQNYGEYFQAVTGSIGLDEKQSRALIGHESRFVKGAKNIMGSKGYMQLTSAPIRDLESRPQLYAELYKKIDISALPPDTSGELKELISIFQEWPRAYPRIKKLIPRLLAKKDEPYLNIAIGSVYLAALGERIKAKGVPSKIHTFVEKRVNIMASSSYLSLVSRRVRDILSHVESKAVREFLNASKNDPEFQKRYLQLRDYNGNTAKYGNGIEHRDIYAAVVLSVSEFTKKEKPQIDETA